MSKVTPAGRVGRIRSRIQFFNPLNKRWVKSSTTTGKFMDVKADSKPFKAVRRSKGK